MDAKSARNRTQMVWSLEDELMEKNDNSRKQLYYLCSDFFFFFFKDSAISLGCSTVAQSSRTRRNFSFAKNLSVSRCDTIPPVPPPPPISICLPKTVLSERLPRFVFPCCCCKFAASHMSISNFCHIYLGDTKLRCSQQIFGFVSHRDIGTVFFFIISWEGAKFWIFSPLDFIVVHCKNAYQPLYEVEMLHK